MSDSILQDDVARYKNGLIQIDELIQKYKPFIISVVGEYKGEYADENDEMITTAMLAFHEAADGFESERGKFYSYARLVIRSRLTDYVRKENNYKIQQISVLDYDSDPEKESVSNFEKKESIKRYDDENENELRRLEIREFAEKLKMFDITLSQLERVSPKKNELRRRYFEAAEYMCSNFLLKQHFFTTKRLPVSEIISNTAITKKQIERGRIYIIAVAIILSGEFVLLAEYIKTGEKQ